MRFTLIKNIKKEPQMKTMLNYLLVFILVFLLLSPFVQTATYGTSIESVVTTLFGNEAEFIDPLNTSYFLERMHGDIFITMLSIILLSTLYVRLHVQQTATVAVVGTCNISAIVYLLSFLVAYFLHYESLIYLSVTAYILWIVISLFMVFSSLKSLNYA